MTYGGRNGEPCTKRHCLHVVAPVVTCNRRPLREVESELSNTKRTLAALQKCFAERPKTNVATRV
eukprot:2225012-Pleurochrysis_carterae.AAC.4